MTDRRENEGELRVIIISFKEPSWVKCCFEDVNGKLHYFNEQVSMVIDLSKNFLDANSQYPQHGYFSCEVLNKNDRTAKIDIHNPCLQRDQNGESIFEVYLSQLNF
jgi:hypothetical protein